MAKRFSDTKLFDQSWFVDLSLESKMIWLYLESSCDHAGIWEIDIPQMRRKLGSKDINLDSFFEEINKDYSKTTGEPVMVHRVIAIHNNTKLWLTGFISEQNEKGLNGINIAVPAVKSAVNRLKDEGILEFALKEGFVRIQKDKNEVVQEKLDLKEEETDSCYQSFPINNPAAKGSEPFERDKDKDKDKDIKYGSGSNEDFLKEIGGAGEKTNEAPTKATKGSANPAESEDESVTKPEIFYQSPDDVASPDGGNQTSLVTSLFTTYWGKKPHTPHEEVQVAQFILDYGYDEVKTSFGEAVNHNRLTLAYIKGILQKRRMRFEAQKNEEAKKAELLRLAAKGSEERQQGIKLNMIQSVYGNAN